jgi:hypothetical protein
MKKKNRNYFIWLTIAVVVIIAIIFLVTRAPKPGKYDALARCLKTQGVIFYGAFWCPHCQNQKALFGSSVQYLPYVECSTPDGQGQLPLCAQNKVSGYPTWAFKDGSRLTGETPLDQLAGKSGCPWPR